MKCLPMYRGRGSERKHSVPVTWVSGKCYQWCRRPRQMRKDPKGPSKDLLESLESSNLSSYCGQQLLEESGSLDHFLCLVPPDADESSRWMPLDPPPQPHFWEVAANWAFPAFEQGAFWVTSGRAWPLEAGGPGRAVRPADGPEEEVICRGGSGVSPLVTRCCISSRVCWTSQLLYHFTCLQSPMGGAGYPKWSRTAHTRRLQK